MAIEYSKRVFFAPNTSDQEIIDLVNEHSAKANKIAQEKIKDVYKTVWEISQKSIIDMAADRGAFVCQSQSMNLFMQDANFGKLTSMHFYAWKKGLKTGMYYLRSKAATSAIQFTVDQAALTKSRAAGQPQQAPQPEVREEEDCLMCGS